MAHYEYLIYKDNVKILSYHELINHIFIYLLTLKYFKSIFHHKVVHYLMLIIIMN